MFKQNMNKDTTMLVEATLAEQDPSKAELIYTSKSHLMEIYDTINIKLATIEHDLKRIHELLDRGFRQVDKWSDTWSSLIKVKRWAALSDDPLVQDILNSDAIMQKPPTIIERKKDTDE